MESLKKEIYISVDIEATGPTPGEYSMFQLGACVIEDELKTFFTKIKMLNGNHKKKVLKRCGFDIEKITKEGVDPKEAMQQFAAWIENVAGDKLPVFVGFNATFDWMFVNWYFHKFLDKNPFGISGLDIKAYYMGMMNSTWQKTTSQRIETQFKSERPHTHNALDDAIEQADMFKKMREYNNSKNNRT